MDSLGKCLIEPDQRNDNGRIRRLENGRIGAAQRARFADGVNRGPRQRENRVAIARQLKVIEAAYTLSLRS